MSDLTGLDQLDQRQRAASVRAKRQIPPAKHPKASIKHSHEAETPGVDAALIDASPTVVEHSEPAAVPAVAPETDQPAIRRRSRVRPTQVHLDETSEDHLNALKKRAVNADVALTASAVLRMALAELVDRYGYDHIVDIFADDASQPRPGRPAHR